MLALQQPSKIPPDAMKRAAKLTLMGGLVTVAFVTVFLSAALIRRRRRLAALSADTARRRAEAAQAAIAPGPDPWAESGRRTEAPSAEALDNDRLDLDDTHIPPEGEGPVG